MGGSDYVLTAKPGSPLFKSLVFPAAADVAAYNVRYQVGTTWSNFQTLQPGMQYTLNQPANAIEYRPLDSHGKSTVLPDGFYFCASYASTGHFSGTLTVSNTQATVIGQIALDNLPDTTKFVYPVGNLTFEFRTPGTSPYDTVHPVPVLFTKTGTLTTDETYHRFGDYALTGVTPGTYDISIRSRNSLRRVIQNVTVIASTTIPLTFLLGEDANGDDVIDLGDFGLLINAYGSRMFDGTGLYNPNVDFNYDGLVDLGDFGLLVNSYGAVSDL